MKFINQTIIDKNKGDCFRACVASLFDLEIIQVPHFILFNQWFPVYYHFLLSIGYDYKGSCNLNVNTLKENESINGLFLCTVNSKTFENCKHSVIINLESIVVHDPNPNKKWLGVNLINSYKSFTWDILICCLIKTILLIGFRFHPLTDL